MEIKLWILWQNVKQNTVILCEYCNIMYHSRPKLPLFSSKYIYSTLLCEYMYFLDSAFNSLEWGQKHPLETKSRTCMRKHRSLVFDILYTYATNI